MQKISIIIVNYNDQKWLKKLFDSIKSQTYTNYEIIVVDNDSTDNSVDFIERNYTKAKLYRSKNLGYGNAANTGSKQATGEFLIFLNPDIYLEEDFLEKVIKEYNGISEKETFGTMGVLLYDYDKQPIPNYDCYGGTIDIMAVGYPAKKGKSIIFNGGSPFFIKRDLYLKTGGFCPNIFLYNEDTDFGLRLMLYGYKHYFCESTRFYHYGSGTVGTYSPKKIEWYIVGELNTILNNFNWLLFISLPVHTCFFIAVLLFYLLSGKMEFVKAILRGYKNIFTHFGKILRFRRVVQANRKRSDFVILKRMHYGLSRITIDSILTRIKS